MDDEVSVTVIATGLGDPAPAGAFRTNSGMVYSQPRQTGADMLSGMTRTAAPAGQSGVTNTPSAVNRVVTPTQSPVQRPVTPSVPTESTVPELNIKMPDFMNSIKK
jgi:cell division protein FtsZ